MHQALGQLLAPGHLNILQDKESLQVSQPCNALTMIPAGVLNFKDSAPKFLHSKVNGRPGQQLTGELTMKESLRRVMNVILTTRHKEDM